MGAPAVSCGHTRGPQHFLVKKMLGWVSRGWSESRTRPADLTPRKALQPAGCNKRGRTTPFQEGPLTLKNYSNAQKNGEEHRLAGGGRRAEPGLRTSRQEKPAATAAKKAPPGPFRYKEGSFRRDAFCFKESKKFRLYKNAHPGLWGYEGPANLHCKKKTKVLRGPWVKGHASQKRATGGPGPQRPEK